MTGNSEIHELEPEISEELQRVIAGRVCFQAGEYELAMKLNPNGLGGDGDYVEPDDVE